MIRSLQMYNFDMVLGEKDISVNAFAATNIREGFHDVEITPVANLDLDKCRSGRDKWKIRK